MKSKTGPWLAFERLSGGAVLAEWALELGDEFEQARRYLRSSGVRAETYPCTNRFPCGCRHRVEPIRGGKWSAVCDCDGCQPIPLGDRESMVLNADILQLAEAVLPVCGWDVQVRMADVPGVWQVGRLGGERIPVFWWVGNREEQLRRVVDELVRTGAVPFALLTPTRTCLSSRIKAVLKREGCVQVVVEDLVSLGDGGRIALKGSPEAVQSELNARAVTRREASELFRGLHQKIDSIAPLAVVSKVQSPQYAFRQAGSSCDVVFQGSTVFHLRNTDGAKYLDHLLHHANKPIRAFELELTVKPEKAAARTETSIQTTTDAQTRREARQELAELMAELEEAEADGHTAKAQRLKAEIERVRAITGAQSLLGGDTGERARDNVRKAIKKVVKNLRKGGKTEQAFGQHIARFLSLGYEVAYNQPEGVSWE